MLLPAVSFAANLVPNSSFEEGETGWHLWRQDPSTSEGGVTDEAARAGGKCFKVVSRGGGANLYSDPIPAAPDTDYTVSAYARLQDAVGARVALWALDADGKTIEHILPYAPDLPSTQSAWARFKSIVRTPDKCRALRVHLICNGGTVWWDAVQLERGRDTTRYREGPRADGADKPQNLLANSGFDEGNAAWTLWRQFPTQSSGEVTANGRSGGSAFHVTNPSAGGANLYSDSVPCTPGTTYTVSVYAKVKDGKDVHVCGWALDGDGKVLSYAVDGSTALPSDVPEYQRFVKTFVAPPGSAVLRAHFVCDGGEVWWSDCQLERGDHATDYAPGPRVGILSPRTGPQAVEYTEAIIREARLRDVLAQTRRLALYEPGRIDAAATEAIENAESLIGKVTSALGAPYLVPDYRHIDFDKLNSMIADAEHALTTIWQKLGADPAGIFAPWQPVLAPDEDKAALEKEFVIFPCFTRSYAFDGSYDIWPLLKPFGFRIVSGWWGAGYGADSKLETATLDQIVTTCGEHGYRCDLTIDGAAAAPPALFARLGDAIYLHNAEGDWSPGGNCHNTINIWHPEVRRVATDFLRQLAAHYAANPNVLSYELTNEPSLTIEKHEHGYVYKPIGVGGYSPPARSAYRKWLEQKYGTVAALNEAWGTKYASFGDIEPPADLTAPTPVDGSHAVRTGPIYDFQTFRAESHAAWFKECLDAMHAADPHKAVVSQFVSGPMDRKDAAVDLRIMAEDAPWDIYGTHDWPGDGPASRSLYADSMNRHANRPHWEDEFIWSQWEHKGTPEPIMRAALERNLWRQIAWGKRGISLFNLESEWNHDNLNNWNNSLLNIEAGLEIPRYSTGVIPTIERKVNLFKDILFRTSIMGTDVAILRPTTATLVTAPERSTRNEGTAVANYLLEQHFTPLMIPEEHIVGGLDALQGFKVLFIPWAINMPTKVQASLLTWIENGGAVFATGPVGLFDEYGKPSATLLDSTIGRHAWHYDAASGRWTMEGRIDKAETRPTAPGLDRLIVIKKGKGQFILWSQRLGTTQQWQVLTDVLHGTIPVPFVQTALPNIELLPRTGPDGNDYLFAINLDATKAQQGTITVRGAFSEVTDLTCESRPQVPVTHTGDVTALPLLLSPGCGVFLELGRPERGSPT